jgi:hypothetical protein
MSDDDKDLGQALATVTPNEKERQLALLLWQHHGAVTLEETAQLLAEYRQEIVRSYGRHAGRRL